MIVRGPVDNLGGMIPPGSPKGRRTRRKQRRVLSEWIAVRVKAKQERYARRMIERTGHRVFLPWIYEEGATVEQPLFPGYIFALGPQWYYLQQTPGVLGPIMMGETPAFMPLKEINALLRAADKEGIITIPKEKFTPGTRVMAKTGAWRGMWGVYIRGTSSQRVRVLFDLLGGKHELEFDHSEITASEHGSSRRDDALKRRPGGRSSPK